MNNTRKILSGTVFAILFFVAFFAVSDHAAASDLSGPDAVTERGSIPVMFTASFPESTEGNPKCYFYVSDGKSTYHLQKEVALNNSSGLGFCNFSWDTSQTSIYKVGNITADLRTIFVFLANSRTPETLNDSNPTSGVSFLDYARKEVTLVSQKSISISISSSQITQGTSVNISGNVSNPGAFTGMYCYFYVGDGLGKWWYKGSSSLADCSTTWDTDETTTVATHGVRVNIQAAGLPQGDPSATPAAETSVKVCAKNSTNCTPAGGSSGSGGTTTGASGSGGSTSGGTNNSGITIFGKPDFSTIEGIFKFILMLAVTGTGLRAFIATLVGGIKFITAGGDSAAAEKGKKSIISGVIGMVIVSLSYSIVLIILNLVKSQGYIK